MVLPIALRKKFDRSLEALFAASGPEPLKPTILVLHQFHALESKSSTPQLEKYTTSILEAINLALLRFGAWIIPVGKRWDDRYNIPSQPQEEIPTIGHHGDYPLSSRQGWHKRYDTALIDLAGRILALVKLVQELPFPRGDVLRAQHSILITLKTEIYAVNSKHICRWYREARSHPRSWETSAFAMIHRQIDGEIVGLLSTPEAIDWDVRDELELLTRARNEIMCSGCTAVNGMEASCACYAVHQPLLVRAGAISAMNCVNEAVKGRLPVELADEILGWALVGEENEVVRDRTKLGGFRVGISGCRKT